MAERNLGCGPPLAGVSPLTWTGSINFPPGILTPVLPTPLSWKSFPRVSPGKRGANRGKCSIPGPWWALRMLAFHHRSPSPPHDKELGMACQSPGAPTRVRTPGHQHLCLLILWTSWAYIQSFVGSGAHSRVVGGGGYCQSQARESPGADSGLVPCCPSLLPFVLDAHCGVIAPLCPATSFSSKVAPSRSLGRAKSIESASHHQPRALLVANSAPRRD